MSYADLPRTDDLLDAAPDLVAQFGRADVKTAITTSLDAARTAIARESLTGDAQALRSWVLTDLADRLRRDRRPGPVRVINATGVVVHTNLGRAPLSAAAVEAVVTASGYCDLEYDLATGRRGSRGAHVDHLLAAATGGESAMVVNNCAAALVLVLSVLAAGRQVPVSRGHLVEIGGSFRLPDIMAASGAVLLEVGTTNRTRAADYRAGDDVAALLTVHPSNFAVTGFTAQPSLQELAGVARDRGVPLVHDAGSGLLVDDAAGPLADEGSMAGALTAGADLVVASADKLLGGPQAGLVVGRADLVARLRQAPLTRALRLDKLRLAALNATLRDHLAGRASTVATAMHGSGDDGNPEDGGLPLADRVAAVADAVGGRVDQSVTMIGGGAAPGVGVPSDVVVLPGEADLAHALRTHDPPVIGRIRDGALLLDLRTVDAADDATVIAAVRQARGA